ncbi:22074_t:CDS:2 [Rhizophagus irregularis]|nr:22074_t:CDS:2 [Rhizophagus irregularis]
MKQTYFKELIYSKNYLIQKPGNLYEQYVNAFAFSEMYPFISQKKTVEPPRPLLTRPPLTPINNLPKPSNNIQLKSNATAQNHLLENLQKVKNDLCEYNNLLQAASTLKLRSSFTLKIKKLEETVTVKEKKLKRLRDNAAAQQRT